MKYNRFFNIHIPKTGGTYFRENILLQLETEMTKNKISTNPPSNGGDKIVSETTTFHWCWFKPFITQESYLFSALRNPARRIVSHYAWQAYRSVEKKMTVYTKDDINKKNFYKWLDVYEEPYKNFQSKNLTYYNKDHSIYQEAKFLGWPENGVPTVDSFLFSDEFTFKVNHVELVNNVKRINLLVKSENLIQESYQEKVIQKICNDLNILNTVDLNTKIYGHENPISDELFSKFSKKEIEKLYQHSMLDSEIYFSTAFTSL
jgi:hypothetical protein